MTPDRAALDDLAEFARIETESHDLEPWAEVIADLAWRGVVDDEAALWLISLYNTYDDFGSAWSVFRRWPSPMALLHADDMAAAADYNCTQERRGLRGGRVLKRLSAYAGRVAAGGQRRWLSEALAPGAPPATGWTGLFAHTQKVWGVGRQSAFEWVEFLAKAGGFDVTAPDAALWESEGPRRSLQRLYGNPTPDRAWLDAAAVECRAFLADRGVDLPWEDFETVICDFNVMRDGRYYPGRHLAALREEIEAADPADRGLLMEAWNRVVPPGWREIAPGIDKTLLPVYRDTGEIRSTA